MSMELSAGSTFGEGFALAVFIPDILVVGDDLGRTEDPAFRTGA